MNRSCPECGYPLQGNEISCPECGLPITPIPKNIKTESQTPNTTVKPPVSTTNNTPQNNVTQHPRNIQNTMIITETDEKNNSVICQVIRSSIFVIAAIICFIFASNIKDNFSGTFIERARYGGDAYTGIQNACADTGSNIMFTTRSIMEGFSYTFIIAGIGFLGAAVPLRHKRDITIK